MEQPKTKVSVAMLLLIGSICFVAGVLGSVYGEEVASLFTPNHEDAVKKRFISLSDSEIEYLCDRRLKRAALYQNEVVSSKLERIGKSGAIVTGNVRLQNGYGAWSTKRYSCNFAEPFDLYLTVDGEPQGVVSRLLD